MDNESSRDPSETEKNGVLVSYFDCSIENFCDSMDLIKELCGLPGDESLDAGEMERFSSMITFLKEWKYFVYEPKTVNFACEIGDGLVKDDFDAISLPQFSSAAVPKMENSPDEARCLESDFVLHAGGLVWAMDWCPSNLEKPDNSFRLEYLAVAAHPPGSTYHKIGAPLTGRGIIQIWCLLSLEENVEISPEKQRKPTHRGRPKGSFKKKQSNVLKEKEESMVQRPGGRLKGSSKKGQSDSFIGNEELTVRRPRGRPKGSGKKRPPPYLHNLNGNMEADLSVNNIVPSSSDLIPLLNADLGGNALPMLVSCALSSKVETLVPKRRRRPSKKWTPSLRECVLASENIGTLPVSSDLNTSLEPSLPRGRGRPRKKPNPSTIECAQAFVVDPEVDVSALPTTRKRSLRESIEPLCTISDSNGYLDLSAECKDDPFPLASSREFGPSSENILLSRVPHDSTGQLGSSLPKRRGRPRKQQNSNTNGCIPSSAVEYEDTSVLPISRELGASEIMMAGCQVDKTVVEGSSVPKRRGRPRKPQNSNTNGCFPASAVESEETSVLPTSRELGASEVMMAGCQVDKTVVEGSSVPKRRGRPRKLQNSNVNGCIPAAAVESEETSVLLTSREIGASEIMMAGCQVDKTVVEESWKGLNNRLIDINRIPSTCTQKQEMNMGYRRAVVFDSNVDCNASTDIFMFENSENAVPTIRAADGISMENHEGLSSCCMAPFKGSTTFQKKRRIKDKARAFSHLERTPSHLSSGCEHNELAIAVVPTNEEYYQSEMVPIKDMAEKQCRIPNDAGLPKVVLCLAHMGKVAWDVKWRPASVNDPEDKQHLGYLAALLGNGSLEVWEVPLPRMVKILHASCRSDGTDPRFLKLKPMFRCSKLQCGDRQSIPLTLEWSPFAPHDLILAGCHDGTVALWKFSKQQSSQDIKPLLCFSADSVPIRSLAWAPDQSDAESANLIVTAGHEGLKFWDLRDPFRPLWEHYPLQRIILSLEWLKDPRCLIMSYDNGELRLLSLWNVANDVLVTGEPAVTTKQPGLHSYSCSDFAIWSVQVSQATGLAAYCTADGSACFFQLTVNAVEKDSGRYREPHFLSGSLTTDESVFKIRTPQPNVPLPNIPKKKVPSEMGEAPLFSFLTDVNQARGGNALVGGDNQTFPVIKSISKPKRSNKKSSNQQSDPGKSLNQSFVMEADEEPAKATEILEEGSGKKFEEFPPKEIAMHKVRWNMNKGSERWLCYGGTAGLIRCQKISRIHGTAIAASPPVCSQIQPCQCKKQ